MVWFTKHIFRYSLAQNAWMMFNIFHLRSHYYYLFACISLPDIYFSTFCYTYLYFFVLSITVFSIIYCFPFETSYLYPSLLHSHFYIYIKLIYVNFKGLMFSYNLWKRMYVCWIWMQFVNEIRFFFTSNDKLFPGNNWFYIVWWYNIYDIFVLFCM